MRFRYCLFLVLLAIPLVLGEAEKCGDGTKCADLTEEEESIKDPRSPYPQAPKAQSEQIREYHKKMAENKKKAAEAFAKGQKKVVSETPTTTTTPATPSEAPTTTTPPSKPDEKTTEAPKEVKKEEKPKKKNKKSQEKSASKKTSSSPKPKKRPLLERAGDFFVDLMESKLAEHIDKNYYVVVPGFLIGCVTMGALLGWLFSGLLVMTGVLEEEKEDPEFVEVTDDEKEKTEEATESDEENDSNGESEC